MSKLFLILLLSLVLFMSSSIEVPSEQPFVPFHGSEIFEAGGTINVEPYFYSNISNYTTPQTYTPSRNYGFQINWTDTNANLENVTFEANFSGSVQNYTNHTTSPSSIYVYNDSADIFYINFTQEQFEGAYTYYYKWYSNDTLGSENATEAVYYTINKADTSITAYINSTTPDRQIEYSEAINFTAVIDTGYGVELNFTSNDTSIGSNFTSSIATSLENSTLYTNNFTDWSNNNVSYNFTAHFGGDANYTATQDEIIFYIADTIAPQITAFEFYAVNSSRDVLGGSEFFNTTYLEEIEYMRINFTMEDNSSLPSNLTFYFTANGTRACSLGNNQSSMCYNFTDDTWIKFINDTTTSTYKTGAPGDNITCTLEDFGSTMRNYTCLIDEHYNPNVCKHYPYNFSNVSWQSASSMRISKNNIWKIEVDSSIVPLDADDYKLDFRANYTAGNLQPTQPLFAFLCNSTYTTGNPETSEYCQLVASKLPSEFQHDGTKFRAIFTGNLTSALGDIKYVLLSSDNPPSKYYYMKTYEYTGEDAIRSSVSTDSGASYTTLSDGYESELNFNWVYDSLGGSDNTQVVFKVETKDSSGNSANSSNYTMSWNLLTQVDYAPIVDIIVPAVDANLTGTIDINWTVADPNGDSVRINISIANTTYTYNISTVIDESNTSISWASSEVADGNYNLTVLSYENETADKLTGNDTHAVTIDNTGPSITDVNEPIDHAYNMQTERFNATVTDALFSVSHVWFEFNNTGGTLTALNNFTAGSNGTTGYSYNFTDIPAGTFNWKWYANDTLDNWAVSSGTLVVSKADISDYMTLKLDGSTSTSQTRTYPNQTTCLATKNSTGDTDCSWALVRNATNILTAENNTAFSLNASGWNYTFYTIDCANYSADQIELFVTINKATSNITLGGLSNSTYPYTITANCSEDDPQQAGCSLWRNTTSSADFVNFTTENNTAVTLSAVGYQYKANKTASENYSSATVSHIVVVTQNATNPVHMNMSSDAWATNSTNSNISVTTAQTVKIAGYFEYANSGAIVLWVSGASTSTPYSSTFGVGSHSIKVNTFGNTNYTANSTGITRYVIATAPPAAEPVTGGGFTALELLPAQAFFEISPTQIIMYAKPGDSKIIVSQIPPTDYTFIVKNTGDAVIKFWVRPQGDYAGWIENITNATLIAPGNTSKILLRIEVPVTATLRDYSIPIIMEDEESGVKKSVEVIVKVYGEIADFPIILYHKLYYPSFKFGPLDENRWTSVMGYSIPIRWTGSYLMVNAFEVVELPFVAKISFLLISIYILAKTTFKYRKKFKHKWILEGVIVVVPLSLMFVW